DQPLLAEVLATVARLCDPVAVGDEQVAGCELHAPQRALPLLERAEHGGRGAQPFDRSVAAQAERRVVPAVDVRELRRGGGENAEEQRGEVTGMRGFPQHPIGLTQYAQWILRRAAGLASRM